MNNLYLQLERLVNIMESEEYNHQSSKYNDLEKQCEEIISGINDYLQNIKNKDQIEVIIKSDPDILYLIPADLAFNLFHRAFLLGSLDKDVILAFASIIYAYGPDWDEQSKNIKEYVKENKFEEAVKVAMTVKYY
jgi:hypothetical protein